MRTRLIAIAIAFQLAVLLQMAGEREWILRTGRVVRLRTAPIDPRDPFRGDYVRLSYELNRAPTGRCAGALARRLTAMEQGRDRDRRAARRALRRDTRVYARLDETAGRTPRLTQLTLERPEAGLYLRGRLERFYGGAMLPVRYGIEALFVQQYKGLEIERGRTIRDGIQVPMEVDVALGRGGQALIRDWRWSALGVGLDLQTGTNRQVTGAVFRLVNVGTGAVAVVRDAGAALRLERADGQEALSTNGWNWVGAAATAERDRGVPYPALVTLAPGDEHRYTLDFNAPDWLLAQPGAGMRSIGGLGWNDAFRLVYVSPPPERAGEADAAAPVWIGDLASRRFTGGGRVD